MYMFFDISFCSTDDWRHHSIVTPTIWEISAGVSLTYVSCGDTGRSLLCYSGCASAVGLHFRDRRRRSHIVWLLPDTHNNADPTDCCSKSKQGDGWNCIMTNVMHKSLIYLSIYFCLTCFWLSLSPSSGAGVQLRQWFKFPECGARARALTPYPADLNHCRSCTPASEDGLKESPKHVRQK
jgi:hypothetical protein